MRRLLPLTAVTSLACVAADAPPKLRLSDESSRQKFAGFFQDRVEQFTGGPRNYAEVLEGIRLCEARKSAMGADVAEFFAKR